MKHRYPKDDQYLSEIYHADQLTLKTYYTKYRVDFENFIVQKYKTDKNRASEIYPEAFQILYDNIRKDKLSSPLQSSLKTYLFGVGKNLYHKRFLNKYNKTIQLHKEESQEAQLPDVDSWLEEQEEQEAAGALVKKLLNKIDPKCRQLLTLIFLKNYANDAVAEEMKIPSEGAVRKRKCTCLKKLRDLLKEK